MFTLLIMKKVVLILAILIIILIASFLILKEPAFKKTQKSYIDIGQDYSCLNSAEYERLESIIKSYNLTDGKVFCEGSSNFNNQNPGSIYLDKPISIKEGDSAILFYFVFLDGGDGDQLGIWIDDEMRFIMDGYLFKDESVLSQSIIDLSGKSPGEHILTIALHSYGNNNNSKVFVGGLEIIPQPVIY